MTSDVAGGMAPGRFGPYRVVRRIGSGGMATVFEAEEKHLGQRVAIKVLHDHLLAHPGAAERFLREGRAVARIRHPHVVQVLGVGPDAEAPYLAMELLDGEDLGARLEREGRLSVSAALDVLLPTLAGVAAAHDAGVIHRDLKPSNIFLSRLGGRQWPKVVDFGISKVLTAEELTASDALLGTVAYMAPEHARSVRGASFSSDQYSIAVVLYQCVTGVLPFSGQGVFELVQVIMNTPVVPPSQLVPEIPAALEAVILRAMDRDPAMRFSSVRAFASALLPSASEGARHAYGADFDSAGPDHDVSAADPGREVNASPLGFSLQTAKLTRETPSRRRMLLVAPVAVTALVAGFFGLYASRPMDSKGERAARRDEGTPAGQPSASASVGRTALVEVDAPVVPVPAAPVSNESEPAKVVAPPPSPKPAASRGKAAESNLRFPSTPSTSPAGDEEACRRSPERCTQVGHNGAPILP